MDADQTELAPEPLSTEDQAASALLATRWAARPGTTHAAGPDTDEDVAAAKLRRASSQAWMGTIPHKPSAIAAELAARFEAEIHTAAANLNTDLLAQVEGLQKALTRAQSELAQLAAGKAGTLADELVRDMDAARAVAARAGFKRARVADSIGDMHTLVRETVAERDTARAARDKQTALLANEKASYRATLYRAQREMQILKDGAAQRDVRIVQLEADLEAAMAGRFSAENALELYRAEVRAKPKRWWQFWRRNGRAPRATGGES